MQGSIELKDVQTKTTPESQTEFFKDCTICWTTAENPVLTKCGHLHCKECFQNLCTAAKFSRKDFSLICYGCQVAFGLEELHDILSPKAFEEVLEASFSSHIQRNPGIYKHCPKPDCGGIYRITDKVEYNSCPKCFTVVCMSCRMSHERETCAEYQYELSDEYQYQATQKLMKELNIKDCPSCGIGIEKFADTCNRVECESCHVHICWHCMEYFKTDSLGYIHLDEKHGGPYDGENNAPLGYRYYQGIVFAGAEVVGAELANAWG